MSSLLKIPKGNVWRTAGSGRLVEKQKGDVWFKNETAAQKWLREFRWRYFDERKYGLMWHDGFFYEHPTVREAVRRLGIREPWEYDAREARLSRATMLSMRNEVLPKQERPTYEDETWYLHEYIYEIEQEMMERTWSNSHIPKHVNAHHAIQAGYHVDQPQP